MRYKLSADRFMVVVYCNNEKRNIDNVVLEGKMVLLDVNTKHRWGTIYATPDDIANEWGFDADEYSYDESNGEIHTWKWYEVDDVVLHVIVYSPKENSNEELGRVVIAVENSEAINSLFTFLTDFKGWMLIETNGDVEAPLTKYGVRRWTEKERELREQEMK
jgi:hypothetical protein